MSKQKNTRGVAMAEILVVLALILLLISLLMPALAGVRFTARHLLCSNNVKQITYGFLDYANSHKTHLPGKCYAPITDQSSPYYTPLEQQNWLYISGTNDVTAAPTTGTIYDYVHNKNMYRCPLLPLGTYQSGYGSNGLFDYVVYDSFYGARTESIRLTSRYYYRDSAHQSVSVPDGSSSTQNNSKYDVLATAIITEQDPFYFLNSSHVTGMSPDHYGDKLMGNWHIMNPKLYRIGAHANQGCVDGSVQFFQRNDDYQVARLVWSLTPGNLVRQNGQYAMLPIVINGQYTPAPYDVWDNPAALANDYFIPSVPTW